MDGQRNTLRMAFLAAIAAAASLFGSALSAETFLLMAEEDGCMWCARWNRDVAPEYPITAEGRAAPLRRIDIHAPVPDEITLKSSLRFTPTFVLVQEGHEVSRIEGYPGEDFFWGLLQRMLTDAGENLGGGS